MESHVAEQVAAAEVNAVVGAVVSAAVVEIHQEVDIHRCHRMLQPQLEDPLAFDRGAVVVGASSSSCWEDTDPADEEPAVAVD